MRILRAFEERVVFSIMETPRHSLCFTGEGGRARNRSKQQHTRSKPSVVVSVRADINVMYR